MKTINLTTIAVYAFAIVAGAGILYGLYMAITGGFNPHYV